MSHRFMKGELNIAKRPDIRVKIAKSKYKLGKFKKCSKCKRIKSVDEFYKRSSKHTTGVQYLCKICSLRASFIWGKLPRSKKIKKETSRRRLAKMKLLIFNHYCNGDVKCNCCGEREVRFLSLDHINGGGLRHKKMVGYGSTYLNWIIKKDYPPIYQVLCHNCNQAKSIYGKCPHAESKAHRKEKF